MVDLPGVDLWLQGALDDVLRRTLVEPRSFTWDVQGWWDGRKREEAATAAAARRSSSTRGGGPGN